MFLFRHYSVENKKRLNDKVIAVNTVNIILKRVRKLNGLVFIDNSNICLEN